MSDDLYIYEQDLSHNKELEALFRKKINIWANAIQHHPMRDLGDKIEICSIWYKPTYPIRLLSQYESRLKGTNYQPYTDQTIPERTYFSLDDVDSWKIVLPEVDEFKDDTTRYVVSGSQHVEGCFKCSATGKITCPKCSGRRKITCPECGGAGRKRCSPCGGRGQVPRSKSVPKQVWVPEQYDSDGELVGNTGVYKTRYETVTVQEPCGNCSGRGSVRCSNCEGTGKVVCPKCSGAGKITCPVCRGAKYLMHYFYVKRILAYSDKGKNIVHETIYDNFPEFLAYTDEFERESIYKNCEDRIEQGHLPEGNHLNEFIDDFLQQSRDEKADDQVMLFQQIEIDRIDTWELNYSFEGKKYTMAFTGSDYEIIPGLSPIYEVAFDYLRKGVQAGRSYRYFHALRQLSKSKKIDVFELREQLEDARHRLRRKINQGYNLGSLLGLFVALLFGGFIAFSYFNEVNYVFKYAGFINRESFWLYKYHAWSMTGSYLILALLGYGISMNILSEAKRVIPFAILRTVTGFGLTMIVSAFLLVLLGLLNVTGITILIPLLVWIVKWVAILLWLAITLVLGIVVYAAMLVWMLIQWLWGLVF